MSTYCCTSCGRPIFYSDDIIQKHILLDAGEYQAEAYGVHRVIDLAGLRRYDCSLHEGWYCCRFIVMRMTSDKFGTGDQLLVYTDAVHAVATNDERSAPLPAAAGPGARLVEKGQLMLGRHDFDAMIQAPEHRDKLLLVKFSAEWCPPCRMMDQVIANMVAANRVPDVRFFEVDIDAEQELAAHFATQSIPYMVFFFNGQRIQLSGAGLPLRDGGLVGGIPERMLTGLCEELLTQIRGAPVN